MLEDFYDENIGSASDKVGAVLRKSYDRLPNEEQRMFLDAAMPLHGHCQSHLESLWSGQLLLDAEIWRGQSLKIGTTRKRDETADEYKQRQLGAAAKTSRSMVARLADLSLIGLDTDHRSVLLRLLCLTVKRELKPECNFELSSVCW